MSINFSEKHSDTIRIVLADDDEDDRFIIKRALQVINRESEVRTVSNGVELLTLLRTEDLSAENHGKIWPHFILLDLNMPCMDGREVLGELKADADFCSIPVIVLTTSSGEGDIAQCYQLGVNSYLVKPKAYDELLDTMQRLMDYWADLVQLPNTIARRN